VVVGALLLGMFGGRRGWVDGIRVVVGGGVSVVDGVLHTGSPGSGLLLGSPVTNTVGIHPPMLPTPTHAHQWLARLSKMYLEPSDWHRNSDSLPRMRVLGAVAPGRYTGASGAMAQTYSEPMALLQLPFPGTGDPPCCGLGAAGAGPSGWPGGF